MDRTNFEELLNKLFRKYKSVSDEDITSQGFFNFVKENQSQLGVDDETLEVLKEHCEISTTSAHLLNKEKFSKYAYKHFSFLSRYFIHFEELWKLDNNHFMTLMVSPLSSCEPSLAKISVSPKDNLFSVTVDIEEYGGVVVVSPHNHDFLRLVVSMVMTVLFDIDYYPIGCVFP